MTDLFRAFIDCRRGATAIEYSILSSMVGLALMVGASVLGQGLSDGFSRIADRLDGGFGAGVHVTARENDRDQRALGTASGSGGTAFR